MALRSVPFKIPGQEEIRKEEILLPVNTKQFPTYTRKSSAHPWI
jgi:hypothetical protein